MSKYKTHLTALEHSAAVRPLSPALKIPHWSSDGETFQGWKDVTFAQFLGDVEQSARYWSHQLSGKGIAERSVVGLWIKGTSYLDVLHIWGVSRAGFTPQVISIRLTSSSVVRELLARAGAKALIFEPAMPPALGDDVISFPAIDFQSLNPDDKSPLPELQTPSKADEIIMIMHSSGSTSGQPKLVPLEARWLDWNIEKARHFTIRTPEFQDQEIMTFTGSFAHIAAMLALMSFVDRGGCIVMPTKIPYSSQELQQMAKTCGINILNMFASFLGDFIRESRKDPALLATLQAFRACSHGGLPLATEEESWAREKGIKLLTLFASTEVGCIMQSATGPGLEGRFLQPFPGTSFRFIPISDSSSTAVGSDNQLAELVIPKEAPDCPHCTLRDKESGDFRTGDLFTEVAPGQFLFKGRNDDWIKMKTSLRCDTRAIEDNAMEVCSEDLISAAVVVGSGRPSPALFVEPRQEITKESLRDALAFKNEILRRITPFHERRYIHERIEDARLIILVPKSTLPRTGKGTIQRKMIERDYREVLDRMYSNACL